MNIKIVLSLDVRGRSCAFLNLSRLVVLIIQLVLLVNLTSSAHANVNVRAGACRNSLLIQSRVRASAHFVYNNRKVDMKLHSCSANRIYWKLYQNRNYLGVAKLAMNRSNVFLILYARKNGRYAYRIDFSTLKIMLLDTNRTIIRPYKLSGKLVKYYPYNWESFVTKLSADVDMVLPGFYSFGEHRYFVNHSKELSGVKVRQNGRRTIVSFGRYVYLNKGWDSAKEGIKLKAGERDSIIIDSRANLTLKQVYDRRFGKPRAIRGKFAHLPVRKWFYCWNLPCFMDVNHLNYVADRLSGNVDILLLKTYRPMKRLANIFRSRGIKPFHYLYMGAVKCYDPVLKPWWKLKDSYGNDYTAPRATGGWCLVDIRNRLIRHYFIAVAKRAVLSGYKGIMLDATKLWRSTDGHVGGSKPRATMSLMRARTLLLNEMKAELKKLDPSVRVGMNVSTFYDQLHVNDYLIKENVHMAWNGAFGLNPMKRKTVFIGASNSWMRTYYPYVRTNLFWGAKSANPLVRYSALHAANADSHRLYLGIAEVYKRYYWQWTEIIRSASRESGSFISRTSRNHRVYSDGASIIYTKKDTALYFNRPLPALRLTTNVAYGPKKYLRTFPNERYIVAERVKRSGWYWSKFGFAYFKYYMYIRGGVMFSDSPTYINGNLRFTVAKSGNGIMTVRVPKRPSYIITIFHGVRSVIHNFTYAKGILTYTLPTSGWYTIKIVNV